MSDAVIYLRRRADEYWALAEEHCEGPGDPRLIAFCTVELALRELAEALEDEQTDAA